MAAQTDIRDPDGLRIGDRILITGADGLVGSALIAELLASGHDPSEIICLSRGQVDLTDASESDRVVRSLRPDVVFHLAARVYGLLGNLANQSEVFLDNIRLNTNVIESSRQIGVRKVVAMGSAAIYSDVVSLPMCEDDVWVGPPHNSERPYAQAKRTMLAQLETYAAAADMTYAYCVSTNLYGPNDRFDEKWGHVIPSLISRIYRANMTGDRFVVWGSGTPSRDLLHSHDAARALLLIAEQATGVLNMASGRTNTIAEIVETLADVTGYTGAIEWDRDKPDGQQNRDYDISRLEHLGFVPLVSLADGLRSTYEWFAANHATVRR